MIDIAVANGFTAIELSASLEPNPHFLETLRQSQKHPLRYLVHNYFPASRDPFVLNLASSRSDIRNRSLAHCRLAIELTRALGGDFYSVHAGFAFDPSPAELGKKMRPVAVQDLEDAYQVFLESVRDITAHAAKNGVRLAIENNVLSSENAPQGKNSLLLMVEAEELLRLSEDVRSPHVGFLIDVGHLTVSARTLGFDPAQFLERVGPKTLAFHLSINDGRADQNLPFDSTAWFLPFLKEFANATMILECRPSPIREIQSSQRAVAEALQACQRPSNN
jgi:sugar phosphate isomerase/epimerase